MPSTRKAAASPDVSSDLVALYRCSCVDWKPSPIVSIAACPDGSAIAVARDDGDIEFWDTDSWSLTSVRQPSLRVPTHFILPLVLGSSGLAEGLVTSTEPQLFLSACKLLVKGADAKPQACSD